MLEGLAAIIFEFVAFILVEGVFEGIRKLFRNIYYWLRKLFTGKDRDYDELKRVEERYLAKKVKLMVGLHGFIPKGTIGTVVEVVDLQILRVEFQNEQQQPIVISGQQVFEVKRNNVLRLRKKRTAAKR